MHSTSLLLQAALDYAARGWKVMPLHTPTEDGGCSCGREECLKQGNQGKHPRIRDPHNEATSDPDRIRAWWKMWPESNIGIACGARSGFWVLDIDGEEGRETLRRAEARAGPLPETVTQITGGGGEHRLFLYTPGLKNKVRFAHGLDVRTDGGLIVVEPSLHVSGNEYRWEVSAHPDDVFLAEAPEWLVEKIRRASGSQQSTAPGAEIREGGRNAALFSLGCAMRRRGATEQEIAAALMVANRERVKPSLDETEIRDIAKKSTRYEPAEVFVNGTTPDEAGTNCGEDDTEQHPFDALVYNGPELLAADIPEPEWLVSGLVARRVMTMLVGIGKLGKSVLAHQLCVAAATEGVWLDQPVPLTPCLYVNWEDPLGLTRARAVQQFAPEELPAAYHTMQPPWGSSFNQFLSWLLKWLPDHGIGLVVIDPLAIAARWKDEKDNAETGPTLRSIQEVAQSTGAAVLVVHHVRKQGGEEGLEVRGGSAIFAGIQGFMSFKRRGPGEYQLDTKDKMPGEHGGDKSLLLKREPHTLTWHVTQHLLPQEQEKQGNVEEVLATIAADPGITVGELCSEVGLPETTVRRYLKPYIESGQVIVGTRMRRESDPIQHRPPKGLFWNERPPE